MAADRERDSVTNILYVRIIRLFLSLVSAWPGDELGGKVHWLAKCYGIYLPFQSLFISFGEIHYMLTNDLDFFVLGETVLTLLLTYLLLIRLIIPLLKGYKEVVRDFFMDFHLIHFKHRGIQFVKVHEIVDRLSLYCTVYMAMSAVFGAVLFNVPPFYLNYKNGAFSHEGKENTTQFYISIYISYPFFNPFENIKAITTFNLYCSIVFGISICILDLLVILMAFHIIGHIVILRKNLESITEPENSEHVTFNRENLLVTVRHEVYTKEENRKIHLILKDSVDHHRVIVRFTYKMSDFFGFMLAFNYTFHLVGLCILLLESTQGSEKLPDALYCIPWECMDMSNQRSVCILLHRLQRPMHITAMGVTPVGVISMAGILKTTFSYFAFLRTLNK